jgi:transposase
MAYNFIECDRDTGYLLPPSLHDWLPEGHLAYFIIDAVAQMDLTRIYAKYRSDGCGNTAYNPSMMTALILYAYSQGERSSRKIERGCEIDVALRVITANKKPDYSTICRFRSENAAELKQLFTDVLRLCREAGLVKVGVVALDGTKIKGSAALSANRTHQHLEEEVEKMFREAKAKDEEEDALYGKDKRGDELPEGLRERKSRLRRLQEAKSRLEGESREKAEKQAAKIAERAVQEEAEGHKKRGRKPMEPDSKPEEEAKANVTDPESRIMKTRSGYVQGYNAQAVSTTGQIIIAAAVTQEANDVRQSKPMIEKANEELKAAGVEEKIGTVLGDAGYWSEDNVKDVDSDGPELLIATNKDWKQRQALREQPPPRGRIPRGLTARERMERKLLTKRGRELYKLRGQTVEPVFGQIKDGRRCDRFMRRGVKAADSEWSLICSTHNLLKLWRSGKIKFGRLYNKTGLRQIGRGKIKRFWDDKFPSAPIFCPAYA